MALDSDVREDLLSMRDELVRKGELIPGRPGDVP